ncbi:hypothetical protein OL548_26040 [Lysinibacillus sp. MHQ-1]|nr:hypothetical protein OL548_26040 [Lysinibacillus sp. MHQ-1]
MLNLLITSSMIFFSAWSVHSKISTAREQVSRIQDDVHNTIWRLQDKHHKASNYLQTIEQEQGAILNA